MSVTITLFLFWVAKSAVHCCTEHLILGYRLDGFTAEEIPNIGVHACIKECLLRKHCQSINYNTQQFLCEINDKSSDIIMDGKKNPDFFFSNVANSCAAGTYGKDGQCIPCPVGQYNGGSNMQWCSICQPGTYQDQTGSSSCKNCPSGTYQAKKGKTSCDPCPIGQHSPNVGSVQCIDCPPGTYQDQARSSNCKPCPSGSYQPDHGKTSKDSCKPCGAGTYQPNAGKQNCRQCRAGYYQPDSGQTSCLFCPSGSYQDRTGQSSCQDCSQFNKCCNQNRTMCYAKDVTKTDCRKRLSMYLNGVRALSKTYQCKSSAGPIGVGIAPSSFYGGIKGNSSVSFSDIPEVKWGLSNHF
ncbi:signal peptide, CUB and EGF-like domain-containing protein 1 [Saccostrea echinata]|uniref:signal peptide, CUB and EGF-like domain-containing protein 1 n=1 Tax=Saccostrea echinata TaxID=191078 RepID=UPI002A8400B7|nr:signal peptide, CUB and EGF-like domain-containing protein 1 [Saccostrea echinata]